MRVVVEGAPQLGAVWWYLDTEVPLQHGNNQEPSGGWQWAQSKRSYGPAQGLQGRQ